ncbi:MAG TPA: 1-deoxy-D-xylulose-5-phosphate synthase [Limnochordia bacterium]
MSRLLDQIRSPKDLRRLSVEQLRQLARELRAEIVSVVTQTGGHLGATLGAIEITLALHSVLDTPKDKLIWDVGHQAYAHKILTGRREVFPTLRQFGGISGFPRRGESEYDAFGTAHAGTSISAALGYALARDRKGERYAVVTVTGDGALTAGMAFEALNHAGQLGTDLVVILNDNKMSIAPNVGALSAYLTRLRMAPKLSRARDDLEALLARIPAIGGPVRKAADRLKEALKHLVVPGAFFEELGFRYYGPIDGHDIGLLRHVVREAIGRGGPVVIHALTEKGRGYAPAEADPGRLHAVPKKSAAPAKASSSAEKAAQEGAPSYSKVFGRTLIEFARRDDRIVAITAAMPDGTGLDEFAQAFPDRFFDVGIAEQHAVTFAAGLACAGMRPVCAIYSTFLQRAYDQVIHDVCIQELPVTFAIDRAGLVGEDGPTHHGAFDLAYLRTVPNLILMAPKDENELRRMLLTALQHGGPAALRYPRGRGRGVICDPEPEPLPIGQAELVRQGRDLALIAVGPLVAAALEAAEQLAADGIAAAVVNARFVKPLDEGLLLRVARETGALLTIEDGSLAGGFGSAVLELLADSGLAGVRVRRIGIPDRFIDHGTVDQLHRLCGLSPEQIADAGREMLNPSLAGRSIASGS